MTPLLTDSHEAKKPTGAVLVVDDDPVVLDALCAQLACDGWDVTACTKPSDALAALRMKKYATIISDQNMPEMKGLEFLMIARGLQPAASRLLITGILSTGTLIAAINDGEIHRFLSKPWTRAELLVSVRNAVQRHEMALANERLFQQVEVLRATLATTEAELKELKSRADKECFSHRAVSSGAGLLTQKVAAAHRPDTAEEGASHVHLVGYC